MNAAKILRDHGDSIYNAADAGDEVDAIAYGKAIEAVELLFMAAQLVLSETNLRADVEEDLATAIKFYKNPRGKT